VKGTQMLEKEGGESRFIVENLGKERKKIIGRKKFEIFLFWGGIEFSYRYWRRKREKRENVSREGIGRILWCLLLKKDRGAACFAAIRRVG